MTETIFHFDRRNFADCQVLFRGPRQSDYYDGDYAIDSADAIEVGARKKTFGPISIIRLLSRSRQRFRRTWHHIRQDGIDLTVLWFVKRGSIRLSGAGADTRIAGAGDFLLTRSATPFFMECLVDGEGGYEVVQVTVPTHVIRKAVPDQAVSGTVIAGSTGRIGIARRVVEDLFDDEEGITPDTSQRLIEAALSLIADVISDRAEIRPKKRTITERRIEDVLRFIDVHLCNPNLSTAMVCQGCGISPRYLTTLLQVHGTSFSSLVWGPRMEKAREWLSSSHASEVPISEVAHGLGFKSVAHFSRRFKQVYKFNPSDCRACAGSLA